MKDEMNAMAMLLAYLFLDLKSQSYIEEEYIAKMKDGASKEIAKTVFKAVKGIAEIKIIESKEK